jgi:PIN domain nuclease of toxin-antitoxin system
LRLLLDTHAVLWWFQGNTRLPMSARAAIDESGAEVFVSAVSAYEIASKHRLGKLPEAATLAPNFERMVAEQGFAPLLLTVRQALIAGDLPLPHRDPFDRLLIAQAIVENLTLVSNEQVFDAAGVQRLW